MSSRAGGPAAVGVDPELDRPLSWLVVRAAAAGGRTMAGGSCWGRPGWCEKLVLGSSGLGAAVELGFSRSMTDCCR